MDERAMTHRRANGAYVALAIVLLVGGLGASANAQRIAGTVRDSSTGEPIVGAVVSILKSGTNQFHGNLYEFLRNTDFDARGFFSSDVAVHHENEFGGTFGGPVWIPKIYNGKNKTFFFVNIEEYRLNGGAQNSIGSVPDKSFRTGDLSGLVDSQGNQIPIYDPNTTTASGSGFTRSV